MLKIVLDTNVFLSGILSPNRAPAKILDLVLSGKCKLVSSPQIIQEIQQVTQYPGIIKLMKRRKIRAEELADAILKILRVSAITPGAVQVQGVCPDPQDDMFLASALEGQADFIISGDQHLLNLKTYQGIQIVNPATFLAPTER
jgi:putative PIN family toxin of toxin-antitoxin system